MHRLLPPLLLIAALFSFGCASKLDVAAEYIMSEEQLRDSLGKYENNLVLFYTGWCGAATGRIKEVYQPLMIKIAEDSLDLQLILLASDGSISIDKIDAMRSLGMDCFYIESPGLAPFFHRRAIKSYIETAFPKVAVSQIQKTNFLIPVELLVTNLVNAKEYRKGNDFVKALLNGGTEGATHERLTSDSSSVDFGEAHSNNH